MKNYVPLIVLDGSVEFDEMFSGTLRRGEHGRVPETSQIIFGMKSRETGDCVLAIVDDRSTESLVPLLLTHVAPGSTVISDKFSVYVNSHTHQSNIQQFGFNHFYINHSMHYVDPVQNFIHTNAIERTWRSLSCSISHVKRAVLREVLEGHIDTFLLRNSFKSDSLHGIILEIIAQLTQDNYFAR